MIVEAVKYFPFNIKLKKPFQNSQFTITHRKGFYLEIKTDENKLLLGEASPLPGFSKESLTTVESEIKDFILFLEKNKLPDRDKIFEWIEDQKISPSTAYAIEQAVFKYNDCKSEKIGVNGLVGGGSLEQALGQVDKLIECGYRTIKIKLGVEPFESDLIKINTIKDNYPNIKIRLDVNGKWKFDEAFANIEKLKEYNIEYIEQPVLRLDELIRLSESVDIKLAADEAIEDFETAESLLNNSDLTLVIKPMTLGFVNAFKLIQLANLKYKKIVVSSLFESSVGRAGNIFLASLLKCKTSHGFATAEFLENEVYNDPYKITDGYLTLNTDNLPPEFEKAK